MTSSKNAMPLVAVVMGSKSDEPLMQPTLDMLQELGIPFEVRVMSAHRTPEKTREYAMKAQERGIEVIIAGAGMCTGGRIKHHLVSNISRPESTILFVGYQAEGTLGRQIVEGSKEVRILGQMCRVRAKIVQMGGFSAHADRDELLRWLSGFEAPPSRLFVTHGEPKTALSFADLVTKTKKWPITVPQYRDQVVLT